MSTNEEEPVKMISSLTAATSFDTTYLCWRLAMGLCNLCDDWVVEQQRCVCGNLHVAFEERLGTKRRVRSDSNTMLLSKLEQVRLDIVGVMLDLECRRLDLRICEHVKQQRTIVV